MKKSRENYVYVAKRIDPTDPQNLGDFSIRKTPTRGRHRSGGGVQTYHYASKDYLDRNGNNFRVGRVINRSAEYLPYISRGSRIYQECISAVERLLEEERSER